MKNNSGALIRVNSGGNLIMYNGKISGNTASDFGGGIHMDNWGTGGSPRFTKTGGIIYGYTSGDRKSNTVKNSSGVVQANKGHAVSVVDHTNSAYTMKKDTTSGPTDNLSFDGRARPPTSNGEWDWDY